MNAEATLQEERLFATIETPVGALTAMATDRAVIEIAWPGPEVRVADESVAQSKAHAILERLATQLAEYFAGERRDFDVPVAPHGTPFQQRVWQQLQRIPHGAVTTYADVARQVECRSARPVGTAIGKNPIPIVIPCHRVIGTDRTLRGFAGGLAAKQRLLDVEGVEL